MKLRLIPDWRRAWRYFSVLCSGLLTVLSVLQATVLPMYQFAIPADKWPWVTAGLGTLIIVVRMIAQTPVPAPAPEQDEGRQP